MTFSAIVLLLLPPALIVTAYAVFQRSARRWGQGRGYLLGFLFYWTVWCLIVPLLLIGSQQLIDLFRDVPNRLGDPAWLGFICLVLPVIGGYVFLSGGAAPDRLSASHALINGVLKKCCGAACTSRSSGAVAVGRHLSASACGSDSGASGGGRVAKSAQ
jgi:hypothetical protein